MVAILKNLMNHLVVGLNDITISSVLFLGMEQISSTVMLVWGVVIVSVV